MTALFIGVDVGVNGGIAVIDETGTLVKAERMPETDLDLFEALVFEMPVQRRAVLEKVHATPQMGVTSAFSFGGSYRACRMALTAARIPFDEVSPMRWQRRLECLSGSDKNLTKARAQQLFPNVRVTHYIADALLLAEYLSVDAAGGAMIQVPMTTQLTGLIVTLSGEDLTWATDVGRMRHLESLLNGRKVRFAEKRPGELWGNHIESACAELATARCAKRKWLGHINRFHAGPDIEDTNWEVRWSAIQQWKVNASHDTGKVVVCVDGQAPTYEIVGWVIPELVRQQDALKRHGEDHDYWLVPKKLITRIGLPPVAVVTPDQWRDGVTTLKGARG